MSGDGGGGGGGGDRPGAPGSGPAASGGPAAIGGIDPMALRYGWLMPAVWLAFLAFPIAAVWAGDDPVALEVAAIVTLLVFAAVYLHGFQRQIEREQQALSNPGQLAYGRAGLGHFVALVALNGLAFALSGLPTLGAVSFVVSFAVFHFTWPVVAAVFAVGVGVVVLIPIGFGAFGDLWFLTLIVITVGVATMLIRVLETRQIEQAEFQTRLAVSEERSRVARDVHDVLGHSLTAVILKVELCQRLLDGIDPGDDQARDRVAACRDQLDDLHTISRSALSEIRSTVGGLRQATLADELAVARTVLADAGVELVVTGDVADVPDRHRTMLAWVVREAVTNIVRHARASRCHIGLAPAPVATPTPTQALASGSAPPPGQVPPERPVLLRIDDDGIGMGDRREGNGIRGLRERVEAAGATLSVRSGAGTQLEVQA